MSVGNLKTEGNKGNNFPWQLKMLMGQQCACDALKAIGIDTAAIEVILESIAVDIAGLATEATLVNVDDNVANILGNTNGVLRSPNMFRTTGSGNLSSVATNIYSVSVANVGLADGIILGSIIRSGEVLSFSADALNNYFNAFAYDGTGTELIVTYIY